MITICRFAMDRYLNRHFCRLLTWMMPYFLIRIWAFKKIAHLSSVETNKGSHPNPAPNPPLPPPPGHCADLQGALSLQRRFWGRGCQLPATRGARPAPSGNFREDHHPHGFFTAPGSAIRNTPIPTFQASLSHSVLFAQVHSGSSMWVCSFSGFHVC